MRDLHLLALVAGFSEGTCSVDYTERFYSSQLLKLLFFFHRNLCNHGKYFLAANSSLCGLAANNFFRSILNVRKAALVSAMPMAVIPFLSTAAVYEVFVRDPLFSGKKPLHSFEGFFERALLYVHNVTLEELFLSAK